MKKILIIIILVYLVFTLFGCGKLGNGKHTEPTDFDKWKNSNNAADLNDDTNINQQDFAIWQAFQAWCDTEEAQDFNGDRKITIVDYFYFNTYKAWRLSSEAVDLDGDRRITIEDYALFIDPNKTNYITWANSENAVDLNDDGKIDENDYVIASGYIEFVGSFHLTNFEWTGDIICFYNSRFGIDDFQTYLANLTFAVDKFGRLSCQMPEAMSTALGTDLESFESAVNACVISRLSAQIATVDISLPSSRFNLSFYLTAIDNGYATSFNMRYSNISTVVSFHIVYDN